MECPESIKNDELSKKKEIFLDVSRLIILNETSINRLFFTNHYFSGFYNCHYFISNFDV